MNLVAGLARSVRQLSIVDHCLGDLLPGGTERFVRAWSVAKRAGLTEDAQPNIMNGQVRDDVFLLHGFVPLAFVHAWSGRSRWGAGLRSESVKGAVGRRRMVPHKLPL